MNRTIGGLAATAITLLAATSVAAHTRLVASNPAANAAVAAPTRIVLTFSERLEPRFSGFSLSRGGGRVPTTPAVGRDRRTLVGSPSRPLQPGVYRVAWRAVSIDGHRVQGAYGFTVR